MDEPTVSNGRRIDKWAREHRAAIENVMWARVEWLADWHLPRPVVLVTGAFDLMHAPHMRLLYTARQAAGPRGTVLVALNSDENVRERKGPGRPVMTWPERAAALAYMPVDVIVEFSTEDELREIVRVSGAELQVAGAEYFGKDTTAQLPLLCVREGGPHTSKIIERIKSNAG